MFIPNHRPLPGSPDWDSELYAPPRFQIIPEDEFETSWAITDEGRVIATGILTWTEADAIRRDLQSHKLIMRPRAEDGDGQA